MPWTRPAAGTGKSWALEKLHHPRQGLARIGLQNQRLLSLDDFSSLVKLLDLGEVLRFIQRN